MIIKSGGDYNVLKVIRKEHSVTVISNDNLKKKMSPKNKNLDKTHTCTCVIFMSGYDTSELSTTTDADLPSLRLQCNFCSHADHTTKLSQRALVQYEMFKCKITITLVIIYIYAYMQIII